MSSTIVSLALVVASGVAGWSGPGSGYPHRHAALHHPGGRILPPGPGYGWGFPNGNPDGYGWFDHGTFLPLGPNRVPEYYFPRYFAMPPTQMFFPSYYNAYVTRGQRYLPYAGGGGDHPAGGLPMGSAETPVHPYQDTIGSGPQVRLPNFNGRIEAPPINSGATGLTP